MRKRNHLLLLFRGLFITLIYSGCSTNNKEAIPDILIFNVTQKYPVKEMSLQDIADVKYIPLETRDDMLWKGQLSGFGKNLIMNVDAMKGDILLFDGQGKALRHIKRQGGSAEEYSGIISVVSDEERGELFVNNNNKKKILVYDTEGNYKRSLEHIPDKRYSSFTILDENNLIAFSREYKPELDNSFFIISKEDGKLIETFILPNERKVAEVIIQTDASNNTSVATIASHPFTPTFNGLLVQDLSNDTIFSLDPMTLSLNPFIIHSPSIHAMESEIFLYTLIDSPSYTYFMTMERTTKSAQHSGYPRKYYLHDKKKGQIFEAKFINKDHSQQEDPIILSGHGSKMSPGINGMGFKILEPMELLDAYDKGQLKGNLKNIASKLNEDDNPVLLIARFK